MQKEYNTLINNYRRDFILVLDGQKVLEVK